MNILFYIIFIIILFLLFFLSVLVLLKGNHKYDNKLFSHFVLWSLLWLIVNFLENEFWIPEINRFLFLKLDFIIALLLSYFWFSFCYSFLEKKRLSQSFNIFALFLFLFFIWLIINTKLVIYNFTIVGNIIKFDKGIFFYLYVCVIIFCFVSGIILLFIKYLKSPGKKRIQIAYTLFGSFLSILIMTSVNLFFQNVLSLQLFRIGNLSIVFFIVFTGYAIIKHHLFDIRVIIQRSLIYSITFALIISFYLVLISILGYFLKQGTDFTVFVSAGITTLVGIYGVQYIERFFQKVTDKIFFKDKYDYQEAIYELSQILNKNIELEVLLQKIAEKLEKIMKVKKAEIYLAEHNIIINKHNTFIKPTVNFSKEDLETIGKFGELVALTSEIPLLMKEQKYKKIKTLLKFVLDYAQKNGISIFSVIRLEDKFIGIIMLGEKMSGDIFNSDDFNFLKTFSAHAAVALTKAQLYAKVKNYSQNLEKMVEQRTKKIRGLQEEQKQIMLEMAHNLQTPLTIIKGELELLKKEMPNNNNLYRFEKSIDKISRFIYDILRLAKLENIKSNFKKDVINFSKLVNELTEYFEVVTEEKGIKIIKDIEPDIYILGQREKIEEMITNIVSNAVKYIDKAKKEHKIVIKLYKEGKNSILTIEDNGIGINKKDLSHLFTKFYRSKNAKHFKIKGSGLGLVISKKIAEMHGGDIKAKSQVGVGTKFIIELPIKKC